MPSSCSLQKVVHQIHLDNLAEVDAEMTVPEANAVQRFDHVGDVCLGLAVAPGDPVLGAKMSSAYPFIPQLLKSLR